ncbi:MAG: CapA family protein [Lachnospiraceae bacterium]|nr:CapA family protein [Candidatus Merdinaster equi]
MSRIEETKNTNHDGKRQTKSVLLLAMAVILAACALCGCGNSEQKEEAKASIVVDDIVQTPTKVPTPTPTPTPTPEPEPEYEPVIIGFVGDVMLGNQVYKNYKDAGDDISAVLKDGMLDHFTGVDVMVANHEYCTTTSTAIDTNQIYNIKTSKEHEPLWLDMGVDVVSLANNHMLDFGRVSATDTIQAMDEIGVLHCGAGENLEAALKPVILERNGKKIAIIAATRVICAYGWNATSEKPGVMTTYESTEYFGMMKDEIKRLKEEEKCDFVIAYVHFGTEHTTEINASQKKISYEYIDSGADLIMGAHAHTLQGVEFYKGKPIYYNMGNFLFGSQRDETMFVEITLNENNSCSTKIYPGVTTGSTVSLAADEKRLEIIRYVEKISVNAQIDDDGNVTQVR